MKSTGSYSLLPRVTTEPQPERVLSPGGCVTPRLPRPPTASERLLAGPPQTTPHTKTNHTKRNDIGSCSDRENPFSSSSVAIPSAAPPAPLQTAGAEGAAQSQESQRRLNTWTLAGEAGTQGPGTQGWGAVGGRGAPGRVPGPGRGRHAKPQGSAPRRRPSTPPAAGRARAPAANPKRKMWKGGGDGIEAHHLPLTAERDRTGGRGAPRPVSLSQASSPTLSSSPPPRSSSRPLGAAGQ